MKKAWVLTIGIALAAGACGDSADTETAADSDSSGEERSNACPIDGCTISIESIEVDGDELNVTWSANFDPDFSRNHIHIYWDNYEAAEVSGDAADNGLTQGEWVPTDVYPNFVTEGAVSTTVRGESTTLCVVAADGDHNVINNTAIDCKDASDQL